MQENNELKIAAMSDIGKKRKNNEDCAYAAKGPYGTILAVADGMGGHRKGEVASKMIIDALAYDFASLRKEPDEKTAKKHLKNALSKVNKKIYKIGSTEEEYDGMGSTVVVAFVGEYNTEIVCAGDSRCYLYSPDAGLRKATVDQNVAQMLFDAGKITYREYKDHPQRNIIYNAIGIAPTLTNLEEITVPDNSYTVIMLCSDGLYTMVDDIQMEHILGDMSMNAQEKARKLIDMALENGGNDNIAVSIMEK